LARSTSRTFTRAAAAGATILGFQNKGERRRGERFELDLVTRNIDGFVRKT
jgi:hypothetical protein